MSVWQRYHRKYEFPNQICSSSTHALVALALSVVKTNISILMLNVVLALEVQALIPKFWKDSLFFFRNHHFAPNLCWKKSTASQLFLLLQAAANVVCNVHTTISVQADGSSLTNCIYVILLIPQMFILKKCGRLVSFGLGTANILLDAGRFTIHVSMIGWTDSFGWVLSPQTQTKFDFSNKTISSQRNTLRQLISKVRITKSNPLCVL